MKHHVILASLDALRFDGLSCYGNPRQVSRNLDALAEDSVIFTNATTPATWTLPAHMSMLTGLEPPVHNCTSSRQQYLPHRLPFPLIFELAAAAGYEPQAVTGGGYMEAEFGFGRGVENFQVINPIEEALGAVGNHVARTAKSFSFFHTYTVHDYPRVATSDKLWMYLQQRDPDYEGFFPRDQDFHALITALGDSADQLELGDRDLAFIRDLYDAAITITDSTVGAFLTQLNDQMMLDDTTIIFTSDHGESLGEMHQGVRHWHHGGTPYQDQVRIPLIIKPAKALRSLMEPGEINEWVSLNDLVPTILDLMEEPYSRDQFDGSSLVDLCLGQVAAFETRRLFFHSCEDASDRYLDQRLYGEAMTWRDNSKLIYHPRTRALRDFYRLDQDPWEKDNRIDDLESDELKRVDEVIAEYWDGVASRAHEPESVQIDDPMVLERLAALGYIDA